MLNNIKMTKPEIIAKVSHKSFQFFFKMFNFCHAVLTGFWLGVLSEKSLDAADDYYYLKKKKYKDREYNKSGLFSWEKTLIEGHFKNTKKILLIAAGGGREVLALLKMGYDVDAFECNQQLIRSGNALLEEMDLSQRIHYLPRNHVPEGTTTKYDGIIIGWGAYSLIRGSKERKGFLIKLKSFLKQDAPLMVSFLTTKENSKQDKVTAWVGNFFRFFRNAPKIEPGDRLVSNFIHLFTKNEILKEFSNSKLEILDYYDEDYGCLIATPIS